MNPVQVLIGGLIAVGIPLVFLLVIYMLDLYASRTFRLVLLCFGWGAVGGLALSLWFNEYVAMSLIARFALSELWLYVAFAPFAEEIFKSISLFYVARRSEFTYFVDGAIYGFASGIGFSITENFLYIRYSPDQAIGLSLIRAFSTCLMHGTAAGLVGAVVGRFRFQKRSGRRLALVGGWLAAIVLHGLFNSISQGGFVPEGLIPILGVGAGLAGVVMIGFVIMRGLKEQRQWFVETLDRKTGVSGAEVRAAQAYASIDEVLEPITKQFPAKAGQVRDLLLRQAQLGIKRKVQQRMESPEMQEQLGVEIERLQAEMEKLRKEVGPYVMVFVRAVFPAGASDVWARLESLGEGLGPTDPDAWKGQLESDRPSSGRNIFDRMRVDDDGEGTPSG